METAALVSWGGDAKRDNKEIEVDVGSETEICLTVFLQNVEEEGRVSFADSEDFIAISAIAISLPHLFKSMRQRKRQRITNTSLQCCLQTVSSALPFF